MVDWSKEVETDETPPRPVRVLFTESNEAYATEVGGILWHLDIAGNPRCQNDDGTPVRLRNVAPQPVRHERWVCLYADGTMGVDRHTREECEGNARESYPLAEIRHIVWNSDGSPVEKDRIAEYKKDRDWLSQRYQDMTADRDAWKAKAERTCNTCRWGDFSPYCRRFKKSNCYPYDFKLWEPKP